MIKIAIYLSLGLHKGLPSYGRSLQPSKENIQHFKTLNFFLFFSFCGSFCPPGSGSGSTDFPDRKHCIRDVKCFNWLCQDPGDLTHGRLLTADRHLAFRHPGSHLYQGIGTQRCRFGSAWIRISMDQHSFDCPGSGSGSVLGMRIRIQ